MLESGLSTILYLHNQLCFSRIWSGDPNELKSALRDFKRRSNTLRSMVDVNAPVVHMVSPATLPHPAGASLNAPSLMQSCAFDPSCSYSASRAKNTSPLHTEVGADKEGDITEVSNRDYDARATSILQHHLDHAVPRDVSETFSAFQSRTDNLRRKISIYSNNDNAS